MNSIEEILNNKANYIANGMAEYWVGNQVYTGYSDYSFIWEQSYVESPERSNAGATGDLDTNNAVFFTPHMTVTYTLMTIDDYRRLMKQFRDKRQYMCKCYDPIADKTITVQMYLATPNMPKFRTVVNDDNTVSLIGVDNYTVELIGTNNPQ